MSEIYSKYVTINASLFVLSTFSNRPRQTTTTTTVMMMMMCNGSKNKIKLYFVLVSLMATIGACDKTPVNHHLSTEPRHLMKAEESTTSDKLLQIRQLVRSLIFEWNFGGESEIEGNNFKPFCSAFQSYILVRCH